MTTYSFVGITRASKRHLVARVAITASHLFFFVLAVLSTTTLAQAAGPTGCSYGSVGPDATTICWLDLAAYNDATARSTAGQDFSLTLPGGYTVTFNVITRVAAGTANTRTLASPLAAGALVVFGNSVYTGVSGKPIYAASGDTITATMTLRNVTVTDSGNNPVTGYALVSADAEETASSERITWTSDQPIDKLAAIPAQPGAAANGCQGTASGFGTTTVICQGAAAPAGQHYGSIVIKSVGATTLAAQFRELSGVGTEAAAFGFLTSQITLNKTVNGRINASDSFDVNIVSPTSTNLATATTGTGNSATTGAITVLPTGSAYTLSEAASAGSGTILGQYTQSWTCTNAATGSTTTLPSGSGTSQTVTPQPGDDITCTITNTAIPPTLSLGKALGGSRFSPNDQFTVSIRTGSASGTVVNATTNSTTTGTGSTVSAGTGTTGVFTAIAGTTYYLTESIAGSGSLSNYTSTITCTDANNIQTGLPNNAAFNGSLAITPAGDAAISCIVTNTPATTGPAWTCNSAGYLFQSPNGTAAPHTITGIDLATGTPTPVGSTADYVNAVGYNTLDNYFYGWDANSQDIVRINSDFSLTHLGAPAGVPSTASVMGDFDNAGHLWIGNAASSTHQWAEIDFAPGSATYGQVLASGTYTNPAGLAGNADWSWINGSLYIVETVTATPSAANHLVKFNPTTHAMTDLGALSFTTSGVGATYADASGFLYAQENTSGTIYRIDPTTLDSISVGTGPVSSGNDGARCASAPIPTITVNKSVAGRVVPPDQFTVSLLSGATTLTSATTAGTGTVAATTDWPVTQGSTYTIRDAMTAGSTNTLASYTSTISCTDTTTNTPVATTGSGPDWSLTVPGNDDYSCTITNSAVAGPAFTCSPLGYLFQASGGVETMYTIDLASGAKTTVGTLPAGINAVGFNTLDNYFYGYGAGQLLRVNADRTYTVFGNPPGLPTANAYDAGDFDNAGHLWMFYTALPNETWAEIDFAPGSPTYGQALATGTVAVAGAFANPGGDVSWIGGALYSVGEGSAAGNQNYLLKFDPVAHTVTNLGTVGFSGAIVGATYTDGTFLYASDNTTGKIWRINVATRATTLITTGPAASGNDGARCATAQIPAITLKKQIVGRVATADDFTVSILNGATMLTSATTNGPGTTATTTNWPVSMGGTYTLRDAMAAGSTNTLAAYNKTIACTDTTTNTPVTPTGAAPNWSLNIPGTDSYTCTITNSLPPGPVCSTSTAYLAQNSPTGLYAEQFGGGAVTFSPIGPTTGFTYNAIGYNPVDGYLYGVEGSPTNGRIVRINPATGAVTDLGAPTPALTGTGFDSGAFDSSGNYYAGDSTTNKLNIININAMTSSVLTLSAIPNTRDYTYGPGGYLWGGTGAAAPAGTLARIDVTSGTVTHFATPAGMPATSAYGAAFTYGNGNIGLSNNLGGLYQIAIANPSSATPTFTLASSQSSPGSANNDGSGCIAPPTDLQIVKSGATTVLPNGAMQWQLTVTNNGPTISSGYTVNDTIPTGYTAISATPGCTLAGNAITCTGGALAVGASAVITVNATAPGATQCLTNTATVLGNEAEPAGTLVNNTSSLQTCVATAPAIQLNKALGAARVANSDQFNVAIHTGSASGPIVSSTTNATTTGTGATVDPNTGTTGAFAATAGTTYFLTEAAAGSANLANYTQTITCVDANGAQTGLPNSAAFSGSLAITPVANASIACTLTNTSLPIKVSITKTANTNTLTPNGTVVYTVTASNVGMGDAPNTLVSDAIPAGIVSMTWTCAAAGGALCPNSSGSGALNQTLAAFPSGSAVVYTLTGTLGANPPATVANTATLTPPGGKCEPNDTSPPCSATITVPAVPQVSVKKTADTNTLTPGGTVHYTIVVTNTGTVAANNTPVSDPVPNGIASATWTCVANGGATCAASGSGAVSDTIATFPTGSFVTYTVTAIVSANPPAMVTNTATVNPPGGICTPGNTQPPCTSTVTLPPVPEVSVKKTADTNTLTPGGTIHYTITVTNTGTVSADNTPVSDPVPNGIASATWTCAPSGGATCAASGTGAITDTIATFPVGSFAVYTVTAIVSANPPASVSNTATVNPPGGLCTPNNTPPPCTSTVILPPVPQVEVKKTADTNTLTPGGTIHYTVTVTNSGTVSADNTPVNDPVPNGIASATWTCAPSGGATCAASGSGAVTDTIATFPAGSFVTYTITAIVSANPPASIANTATVNPPGGLCMPNNTLPPCTSTVILPPVPQVEVKKTADTNTLTPGGTIHYTVTVTNTGSVSADNTPVSDPVPNGIASATWTCTPSGGATCAASGTGAISDIIATFPAGSFVTYMVTAIVSANPPAMVTNTATVDPPGGVCTPNNTPPPCTATVILPPVPQVEVKKTADTNTLTPGGTIHYTVTVTNTGTVSADNTPVSDPVPNGIASATWTCVASGGAICAANGTGAITDTIATFPVGSFVTYNVTAIVSANPPAMVTNTATVDPPGGVCTPNDTPPPCTSTVILPPVPQVEVKKTADTTKLTPGGTIHYTVTVTNTGTVSADNTPVSDPVPNGIASATWTCVANGGATCAASGTGAITDTITTFPAGSFVTYTVTAIVSANPPASVTNTATVDPPGGVCTPNNTPPPCTTTVILPPVPQVEVKKTADTNTLTPGGTIHYTVTVTNTGTVSADNTPVNDPVPNGIASATWTCVANGGATCAASGSGAVADTIATFPAGSFVTYTVTAIVGANPPAMVSNTVTVDPPGGVCTPNNTPPPCTATVILPPVPQVDVKKTADTNTLTPGGTIHYTVTVTNTGSIAADNTPVSDPVPNGIASATWTCVANGGATCAASGTGAITDTITTFPVGSFVTYTVTAVVSASPPASITNTASANPPGGVCTPSNTAPPCTATLTLPPVAQVSITKIADTSILTPGATIHYTITATNTGAVDASGALVTDTVPLGIASATWTCTGSGGANCGVGGSGAINDTVMPFPAGSVATYTVTATIAANPPASVANTATIDPPGGVCSPNNTPPPCSSTVTLPPVPQIEVKKTADTNTLTPSGTIHYTVTVTNTGSVAANNTPVSDPMPAGIVSATWTCTPSGGATCTASGTGAISDTIATFPAGSFVTYTVTAIVAATPPASVTNTATVDPPGGLCTPSNTPPPCTTTVILPPVPQVDVKKTADTNTLTPGGTIHYTITVTNVGAVAAPNTQVSDPIPTGIAAQTWSCVGGGGAICPHPLGSGALNETVATLPPSSMLVYTITATVSPNPPATVTNTATVDPPGGVCAPNNTPPPCTSTVVLPPIPQVSITKTTGATTLTPNGTIVYTVTASNVGTVDAPNTAVSDAVPSGISAVTWTCAANGGAICPNNAGNGALNETIAIFPPGSTVVYTLTATVSANPPAQVTNIATLIPPSGLCEPSGTPPPCTTTVIVPPVPQVSITKTASTTTLTPSGTIVYTVTAGNVGVVDAPDTVVSDPVPAGIISMTWTCAASGGAVCPNASGSGALNETVATFPGGSTVVYTLTATVSAAPPAQVTNTATLTPPSGSQCQPNGSAPPCTTTVTVSSPNLFDPPFINKAVSSVNLNTLRWTIVVDNNQNASAQNTEIRDPMPANTVYVSGQLTCQAFGGSTISNCTFDGGNNRIVVDALLQSDFGNANPAAAPNRIVVVFETTFVAAPVAVTNVAAACWDANNNSTSISACQQSVQGSAAYAPSTPPVPTPINMRWMLIVLLPLLIAGGIATHRRRRRKFAVG